VLPRLEALSVDELAAVQAYEAAHRGRKTILGRIAQVSQSQGASPNQGTPPNQGT
jgi:hypothetical protein